MARRDATENWAAALRRQGGQLGGGEDARCGESGDSAAAVAQRRRRDMVPMARKALMGRTNARAAGQAAAVAAAAVAVMEAQGQISLFSTAFPLFSSSPA